MIEEEMNMEMNEDEMEEKTQEQVLTEIVTAMSKRTLEELNQTELSQALKQLTAQDYLDSHDLILAAAMDEYLTEVINEPQWSKIDKYIAEMAQNQIEVFEFRKQNPQFLYLAWTMHNPKEIGETDMDYIRGEWELLELLIPTIPDEWTLGSVCQQMLETMGEWFRLEPEFPELL